MSIAVQQKSYLLDGPMMLTPERKQAKIEEMSAHLRKDGRAFLDRGDAIRLLRALDYSVLDVMLCVDDAMHLAVVDVVAREMGES